MAYLPLKTALLMAMAVTPVLRGQTPAAKTPEQIEAAYNAHKSEFDYLLGDWTFTSHNKQYGDARGVWSAVRLAEGQLLDEYRLVGDSGETWYVTTTIRNYNAVLDRWELVSADGGSGLLDFGTGQWTGNEMHIEQRFGVAGGSPSLWRIRYFDITPDSFSWRADRSIDDGKTWVQDYLTIQARRTGPSREWGPLAQARRP
jgi:uncharacterized protein YutD